MQQRSVRIAAMLAIAGLPCAVQSQQPFPTKPVRMIVGYTPGSEIDVVGRLMAQEMSEKWGQRVIVDNRSGAGGTLAGAIVANSIADGYTWFFNSVSHTASLALYTKLSFHPVTSFAFVSQATSAPNVLVTAPSKGITSTKALIALAKQKPGQLNYGAAGVGSGTHINGELFRLAAGMNVINTPYKGTPELLADVVTARIDYCFSPIGSTIAFVKDRRLVALGVTTLVRSPSLPDIPTVAEAGLPGFEWDQWYGMFVPARTPPAIIDQIAAEMVRVLNLPAIRDALAVRGSVPKTSTPAQFEKAVRVQVDQVTKALKAGGVKID